MRKPAYQHLLPNGAPVPFVAMWSAEVSAPCELGATRSTTVHHPDGRQELLDVPLLVPADLRGQGHPVLGKMHEARQRQAVMEGRCQVCAGRLSLLRWLIWMPEQRGDGPWNREPWTCAYCTAVALGSCPGLRHVREKLRSRGSDLFVLLVGESKIALTMHDMSDETVTLGPSSVRPPYAWTYAIIQPSKVYLTLAPEQFLEASPSRRARWERGEK